MDAIQIIVEGSGDVLFVMRLLTNMEPKFVGRWAKCPHAGLLDDTKLQPATLSMKAEHEGRLLTIHAMNGVKNIFPMPMIALKSSVRDVGEKNIRIIKNVFIVDADDSVRGNGTGGITNARTKIEVEVSKCKSEGIACTGFAMPDDKSDGTLENLLEGMIPQSNRNVIDCCWRGFETCTMANGAKYLPPLKSMIDVYAKLFNRDANQGIFASCSFKDKTVWDWNASVLTPIKQFLKKEVLEWRI